MEPRTSIASRMVCGAPTRSGERVYRPLSCCRIRAVLLPRHHAGGAFQGLKNWRDGFTLVELLAVIAIVMILMALLVPGIMSVYDYSRRSMCGSRLRNIGTAFMLFAADHGGILPGVDNAVLALDWQKQWIGDEVLVPGASSSQWCDPGHIGTLVPYLDIAPTNASAIYRCPGLPVRPLDSGLGSNGMFDYAMIKAFAGAPLSSIPHNIFLFINTPNEKEILTPLVVEEDPEFFSNNYWINTGHCNNDRLGSWHNGKGNYVALDGSVQSLDMRTLPPVPGIGHVGPAVLDYAFKMPNANYYIWDSNIPFGEWHQ